MPEISTPLFKQEKPETQKIWRYLTFEHFVDLLSTKTLYFSRVDRVKDDPLEGLITDATFTMFDDGIPWESPEAKERAISSYKDIVKKMPYHVFVNCWHMNDKESMAMWKIYGKKGIVIQSTIENLKKSINDAKFHYAEVEYITETDIIPTRNVAHPFGYKRKSFDYEKEFRAIRYEQPPHGYTIDFTVPNPNEGLHIPIDINRLINRVHVFPYAPKWFYDCTKSIMEKYELANRIEQSNFTIGLSY